MIPFLKQIAIMVASEPGLSEKTFIFPNRRSSLSFRGYLSEVIDKPTRAPDLTSIEHFFLSHSPLIEPDRLTLIYRLYKIYKVVMSTTEPFYRFYFWGDMLLYDFDEIDKALIDTSQLFRDLRNLKEIDASFDFMTEDQKVFLKTFWRNAGGSKSTLYRDQFLKMWNNLPTIYRQFAASLRKDQLGYEGLIQRQVVDELTSDSSTSHIFFVGFNALTRVEEKLICHYVKRGSGMYWDIDAYYTEDPKQEAGKFFRRYQHHPVLGRTFVDAPSMIEDRSKVINLVSAPQHIAQTRLLGRQLISSSPTDQAAAVSGSTAVVMPDEKLLFPMLYALPDPLSSVNITMGYPVLHTPLYEFLELAVALQKNRRKNYFHHESVINILNHIYVRAFDEENVNRIRAQKKLYLPSECLSTMTTFGSYLFAVVGAEDVFSYLLSLVEQLGKSFTDEQSFDRQCAHLLHRQLSHMQTLLCADKMFSDWGVVEQLLLPILSSQKIPFDQKGHQGVQVMGLLETRNLDFENVHILSLNEGVLPPPHRQHSYIPYHLRKAYGLLTYEDYDAMHAYLFYRLLQRAKTVWMYYTTQVGVLGSREVSRYVKQLLHESGLSITHYVSHDTMTLPSVDPISIDKAKSIDKLLEKYRVISSDRLPKMLTPSALNDYLDCRLRFYFKHVAGLYEHKQIEELDMRIFGLLLHESVCIFYALRRKKNKGLVIKEDLQKDNPLIGQSIDKAFEKHCPTDLLKATPYRGRYRVIYIMIEEWFQKIIERDRAYAPFTVLSLEEKITLEHTLSSHTILLGGIVDRIDRKGAVTRIVDYKTGGDESSVPDIASLFEGGRKRNTAAFQTFFYAYLYAKTKVSRGERVMPGIMNRKNLFATDFTFGHFLKAGKDKSIVEDIQPHIAVFEKHLCALLEELYNPAVPFDQTTYTPSCTFCSYKSICNR